MLNAIAAETKGGGWLNQYWLERGEGYLANDGYRLRGPFYRRQEKQFIDVLRTLKPSRILEVGCGFGRMTRAMAAALPDAHIFASDLSGHQIEEARRLCVGLNVTFEQRDLYFGLPFAVSDVAIAAEVFFHLPEWLLRLTISLLLESTPVVIHDFAPDLPPGAPSGPHYFAHDYPAIYQSMGLSHAAEVRGEHGLWILRNGNRP